jgi:Flp pilus assembly protein TadD
MQPDFAQAHNNLGTVYFYLGKNKQARKSYLEALRLKSEWGIAIVNLAMSYLSDGRRDEARECLNTLKKFDAELAEKLQKELYKNYIVDVPEENNK